MQQEKSPDRRRAFVTLRNPEFVRLSKFVAVGVLNTIIGYGAFFLLSYYLYYLVALVISHLIGVANSYIWNKYWTFGTHKNHVRELVKFNIVYLVALLANIALLGFLVGSLNINPRIGQLLALPLVTFVSYFGHKYWSFRTKKQ